MSEIYPFKKIFLFQVKNEDDNFSQDKTLPSWNYNDDDVLFL